jgi:Helix-turn-helix domain/RodZ C-terminal domain
VFEIGTSLRAAREHQKLELAEVERETRIRAKYLRALEDEQFDVLPGTAYVKGFLRTYADFLGLDGPRFVDEFNERFAPAEMPEAAPPVRILRPRRFLDARLVAIPLAIGIGLFAWRLGSGGHHPHHAALSPAPPHVRVSTSTPAPAAPAPTRPAAARIVFVAARGPCWLGVRLGSATGKDLYERTLEPGQSARFAGRRLWVRIGAPWNVDATLNGKPVGLPPHTGDVLVTAAALRSLTG